MRLRALMVDVDGVIVRHPVGRTWYSDLYVDLGIDPEELDRRFFGPCFDEVLEGRRDLLDALDAILPSLGSVSSTELVEYWFSHDATLDDVLLADLRDAKRKGGFELHLATDQEPHRARFLWEVLRLCDDFDAMHYAADVGARKSERVFYRTVELRTGLWPEEHCLLDDRAENVDAARAAGWQAFLWSSRSRFKDVLACIPGSGLTSDEEFVLQDSPMIVRVGDTVRRENNLQAASVSCSIT